jgi:uncharacterized membrane protein
MHRGGLPHGSCALRAAHRRDRRRHDGGADIAASTALGIHNDFIREVEDLLKPGTSALFVLDVPKNLDMILDEIRGLGGTVLRTNVDVDQARLVQSALNAGAAPPAVG